MKLLNLVLSIIAVTIIGEKGGMGLVGAQNSSSNTSATSRSTGTSKPSSTATSSSSSTNTGNNDDSDQSTGSGQPGRMVMKSPAATNRNPLFELNGIVQLEWSYDNFTTSPPAKLMIVGTMPNDPRYTDPNTKKPYTWNIASNLTGGATKYSWDTSKNTPQGIVLAEGTGYTIIFYDGDAGIPESYKVVEGRLYPNTLTFSMFRSRYDQTNDGVPKGYDPSSAISTTPSKLISLFMLLFSLSVIAYL